MSTATLVAEGLPQFCPVTNLYRLDDGAHLLITVKDPALVYAYLLERNPEMAAVPIGRVTGDTGTEVFAADEHATVLDADGQPAATMTPIAVLATATDFSSALAELGHTIEQE